MIQTMDKSIEVVFDGNVRLALVGEVSTGKSAFTAAILPHGVLEHVGWRDGVVRADAIVLVHRLSRGGLSVSEAGMVKEIMRGREHEAGGRFFAVGTFVDVCDLELVAEAYDGMVVSLGALMGCSVPVFAVAPPLWNLACREQAAGREVAARCFRESSGILPVIDHIRALTGRMPVGPAPVGAREVAAQAMRLIGEALTLSAKRLEEKS